MKENIVKQAELQFKKIGVPNVSIRDIANPLGISSGNFAYHFKNIGDLLNYIYKNQYCTQRNLLAIDNDFGLNNLNVFIENRLDFNDKYSYFELYRGDIYRISEQIKKSELEFLNFEINSLKRMIEFWQEFGLLQVKPSFGDYESISDNLLIQLYSYPFHKKLATDSNLAFNKKLALANSWQLLLPHLSIRGWREFEAIEMP